MPTTTEKPKNSQEELLAKFEAAAEAKRLEEEAEEKQQAKSAPRPATGERMSFPKINIEAVNHPDQKHEFVVGRVLGLPATGRELASDVKRIFYSDVMSDENYHRRIYWAQNKDQRGRDNGTLSDDFLMMRIYDAVMERGEWDETIDHVTQSGKKGFWTLPYKDTESYRWIKDMANSAGYTKPFLPPRKGQYAMNWLSREDDWCAENKHSKILGTRFESYVTPDGETRIMTKGGISSDLYDDICAATLSFHRHWSMDIAIEKTMVKEAGSQYAKPKYKVRKLTDLEIPEDVRAKFRGEIKIKDNRIAMIPLTEEEQQYELYDLDRIFQPRYFDIMKNFGKRIQKVDEELNTTFFQDLERLVEEEKERRLKAREAYAASESQDDDTPF